MKPAPFTYIRADTLAEATDALGEYGEDASVLAGGQSLIPLLNMRLARPDVLVDVNGIQELAYIAAEHTGFRIGATTRASVAEDDPVLHERLPLVPETLTFVGHPQIRRRTTIGGNLAHADPSSELPAVVAALDGEVVLRSSRGQRVLAWDEFFVSVFTTARRPDELVTELRLPVPEGWQFGFQEFAARHGDFPIVALATGVQVRDGQLTGVRLAATGVGTCVTRLYTAESLGRGRWTDELIDAIAAAAGDAVTPTADSAGSTEYRRSVLRTLVRRALADLRQRAGSITGSGQE